MVNSTAVEHGVVGMELAREATMGETRQAMEEVAKQATVPVVIRTIMELEAKVMGAAGKAAMVLDMRQDLIMEGIRVGKCQPVGRLSPKVEVPAGAEAITPATRSCTGEIIWASESLLFFQF